MSGREQEPVTGTTTAQILGALEALLFVLIGVVAVRLPALTLIPVLIAILGALFLIRWMTAAPARKREAPAFLWRRYEQRSLLLNDLQEILSHKGSDPWSFHDLTESVTWWLEEDLYSDLMNVLSYERDEEEQAKSTRKRVRRPVRYRWRMFRSRVRLRLEGAMTNEPDLIDAVHRTGNVEVARIVLARGIAEGFVIEHLAPDPYRARILYGLNTAQLRTPDGAG